jgi:hypothetical protein
LRIISHSSYGQPGNIAAWLWRRVAARLDRSLPGFQIERIVVDFDGPQTISRLVYEVEERWQDRTQEVRVEVSDDWKVIAIALC